MGVQQLVRKVRIGLAQELVVQLDDLRVAVRNTLGHQLVLLIEGVRTFGAIGVQDVGILVGQEAGLDVGLATAGDTAARAAHDLDEEVGALAFADLVQQDLGVLHAVSHSHFDLGAVVRVVWVV